MPGGARVLCHIRCICSMAGNLYVFRSLEDPIWLNKYLSWVSVMYDRGDFHCTCIKLFFKMSFKGHSRTLKQTKLIQVYTIENHS